MKSSHQSKASENVNKLLETLRQRRSKLYEKSPENSKFSKVSVEESEYVNKSKKYGRDFESGLKPPELSHYKHNDSSRNPLGMTSFYSSQRGVPIHENPSQSIHPNRN